jgi:hypothetical protein
VEPEPGLVSVALSGELIPMLRRGLLRELASTGRELSGAVARSGYERDAGRYYGPLGRQDSIRALLDLVGWENTGGEQEPVTVYLDRYRGALLAADRMSTRPSPGAPGAPASHSRDARRQRPAGCSFAELVEAIGRK